MTKRRRHKPAKPRTIAPEPAVAIRSDDDGLNLAALKLPANSDVKAEGSTRRNVERARRLDVFAVFLSRDAIPLADYDAVRRLEADIHLAAGVANIGEGQRTGGGGCAERITQRMIDASARASAVALAMPVWHARLLQVLLSPDAQGGVLTRWRQHVLDLTGVRDAPAQADVIRWASAAVREAYASLDYEQRRCA